MYIKLANRKQSKEGGRVKNNSYCYCYSILRTGGDNGGGNVVKEEMTRERSEYWERVRKEGRKISKVSFSGFILSCNIDQAKNFLSYFIGFIAS